MVNPGRRADIGRRFVFGDGILKAEILDRTQEGTRIVKFEYDGIFEDLRQSGNYAPTSLYT